MSDPLREILASPLDDQKARRPGLAIDVAIGLAAILVAMVATLVLRSGGATAVPVTTITTSVEPPGTALLPAGFTDTGRGFGIRTEWAFRSGDDLILAVSTVSTTEAHPVDLEPVGTTELGSTRRGLGLWILETAGNRTAAHSREFFDEDAAGSVTLLFEGVAADVSDIVGLALHPAASTGLRSEAQSIEIASLPMTITDIVVAGAELVERDESGSVTRTREASVVVDLLELDWNSASASWHLDPADGLLAILEGAVTLTGDTNNAAILSTAADLQVRFLQRRAPPFTPSTSGRADFRKADGAPRGAYEPEAAEIVWTVSWIRFVDEAIDVPIEDVVDLGAVGDG